jgi:hypothetical protein
MSEMEQNSASELECMIDRLIDDELNDNQVRELLLALEAQPEGWRRCALAFVESQTLRRDLAGIAVCDTDAENDAEYELVPAGKASRGIRLPAVAWAALAAGLLLAFALGTTTRGFWSDSIADRRVTGPEEMVATTENNSQESIGTKNNAQEANDLETAPANKGMLMVSLPMDEGETAQSVKVPLVEGGLEQLKTLFAEESAVLSAAERTTLESTGHEIEQQRAFYPVKLDDGRQAVLPMDIVKVRYTGGWQ